MADFVLYLLLHFALRFKMVEFHPKSKKSEFPAGNVEGMSTHGSRSPQQSALSNRPKPGSKTKPTPTPKSKTFYRKGRKGRREHPPQRAKPGLIGGPGHGERTGTAAGGGAVTADRRDVR